MNLTSLQIEGITRSNFNFDNYDFSTKKVAGNRRLIHVSTLQEDGKKQYYSYEMKRINKTTVNLRCHKVPVSPISAYYPQNIVVDL